MVQLAKREDQIMQIVWRTGSVFIRDIIAELPEPKPHYNSVATIVKILVKKGFLGSEKLGNTHQYTAAVAFEDYRAEHLGSMNIKKKFFGGSFSRMVAHFAKGENLSDEEIEELVSVINKTKES
jgi:BlaI family penicillinase repressor